MPSIRKVQRIGRTMVQYGFPIVTVFTLINMYLLTFVHIGRFETTFIFNKRIYNSDSSSKKLPEFRGKYSEDDNSIKVRQFDDTKNERNENDIRLSSGKSFAKSVKVEMKDESIDRMVEKLKMANQYLFFPKYFWNISLHDLTRRLGVAARRNAKGLPWYDNRTQSTSGKMPAWKLFHRNIRQFSLYDPDDPNMYIMLNEIATLPIIEADANKLGTQLKINVRFSNEGIALLKFMRYPRHVEVDENLYIFDDMERHVAEIAAFQLDKILGFYRVPPTIGRRINITSELEPILPESIMDTLFTSPAKRDFSGSGVLHLSADNILCTNMLNLYVDKTQVILFTLKQNARGCITEGLGYCDKICKPCYKWNTISALSSSKFRKAYWEEHGDLCESIRNKSPYHNGKLLLDMVDAHTFDFLTGNKDRHSFTTFIDFGNYTFPVMFDNGRGKFRKAYWEEHGDLCESIRNKSPYHNGKLLLDMVDAHTFDFLTGNKDRHSFTTFIDFGNYTFPVMFDNGRGMYNVTVFGRQTYDAMSILAPLRKCCLIRKSTLLKYVKLYVGPERLSVLMEKALEADPLAPVLIKPHINALERRLLKILQAVAECIEKHPVNKVVIFDRF